MGTAPNVWRPSKCCITLTGQIFCFGVCLWCRVSLQYGGRFYESPQAIGAQCNKPSTDAYPSSFKDKSSFCSLRSRRFFTKVRQPHRWCMIYDLFLGFWSRAKRPWIFHIHTLLTVLCRILLSNKIPQQFTRSSSHCQEISTRLLVNRCS